MVMFVIGGIQYFMKRLLSFIFPLPYHNFVDLCSIANISVFIFDERIHGYYIHGESTGGQADVSTRDLKENLDTMILCNLINFIIFIKIINLIIVFIRIIKVWINNNLFGYELSLLSKQC